MALERYKKELEKIKGKVPEVLRQILIDNKSEILRILKEEQLSKGLNPQGNIIGRYSPATDALASSSISIALGEGPRKPKIAGQPYNFEWTGDFFDEMHMFFEDMKSYSIFSEDGKAKVLADKFGDITALTKQNNEIVNNEILIPNISEWLMQQISTRLLK